MPSLTNHAAVHLPDCMPPSPDAAGVPASAAAEQEQQLSRVPRVSSLDFVRCAAKLGAHCLQGAASSKGDARLLPRTAIRPCPPNHLIIPQPLACPSHTRRAFLNTARTGEAPAAPAALPVLATVCEEPACSSAASQGMDPLDTPTGLPSTAVMAAFMHSASRLGPAGASVPMLPAVPVPLVPTGAAGGGEAAEAATLVPSLPASTAAGSDCRAQGTSSGATLGRGSTKAAAGTGARKLAPGDKLEQRRARR